MDSVRSSRCARCSRWTLHWWPAGSIYLAFDLFVGSWIVEDGLTRGINRFALIPCLGLTFLFGPAGLLLFLGLRLLPAREAT